MLVILFLGTVLVSVFTFLPMTRYSHWTVRGMDFPRVQLAILASLLLLAQLCFLDLHAVFSWVLIAVTGGCVVWQLWWVLPYTVLWPKEVLDSKKSACDATLSILTSNVLTPNRNADALIELVQQYRPDILVTLESDLWWESKLECLEADMPYTIKCPLDNLYGMHVFSRLPLLEAEVSFLVEEDVPSMHGLVQLRSGDTVRVHFLHPAPPSPTENPESEERDAELIIVARSIAESEQPVVVAGDLNDVAWSATTRLFRKISGLLDPRVGRGMFNTFHVKYPFLRWPLDHLFHSEHFTLQHIERLPSIGSDHFPLLTSLSFSPSQQLRQNGLSSDAADRKWAKEITAVQNMNKSDVPQPGE